MIDKDQWKEREKGFEDNKEFVKGSIVGEIIAREIPKIVGERQTQDYRVMHYRLIRDRIIDFSEWPSRQLPIPFVDGDSYYIEGRQYTKSFIHEARDAQRQANAVWQAQTNLISINGQAAAKAPRARQLRGKLRPPCSSSES